MKNTSSKLIWGILLVLFGLALMARQFGLFKNFSLPIRDYTAFVITVICFAVGISYFLKNDRNKIVKEIQVREKREKKYQESRNTRFENTNYKKESDQKEFVQREFSQIESNQEEFAQREFSQGESNQRGFNKGKFNQRESSQQDGQPHDKHYKQYNAFFSSNYIQCADEVFQKANITSILGNVQLDLRGADFIGDGVLEVTCVLGGIDIFVPSNIHVVNHCTTILSGVDNTVMMAGQINPNNYTLHIKGICLLGGIEIR